MHEALGRTTVGWRDGVRRMVQARNPELLRD
jgi:UDP-glucuronate 4-epimerase